MEMSMLGKRMHMGRAKDIFVREAEGRGRVATRDCSCFVLALFVALAVNISLSWSIEISAGFAPHPSIEYVRVGSRITATAAQGARAEAADTSRTICWRQSWLA